MLLSMLISFLLARKLRGKIYVLLMTVVLILVSLSSIGFPSVWRSTGGDTIWQVNLPVIPLSFPFHISISRPLMIRLHDVPIPDFFRLHPLPPTYEIGLYFLTIQIWSNLDWWLLTSQDIILLVSSFLLINIVGAIIGYWISKTTFIGRYFARRKTEEKDLVDDVV